eukprot:RCo010716
MNIGWTIPTAKHTSQHRQTVTLLPLTQGDGCDSRSDIVCREAHDGMKQAALHLFVGQVAIVLNIKGKGRPRPHTGVSNIGWPQCVVSEVHAAQRLRGGNAVLRQKLQHLLHQPERPRACLLEQPGQREVRARQLGEVPLRRKVLREALQLLQRWNRDIRRDLRQLVGLVLAWKQGLPGQKLHKNTPDGPDVHSWPIGGCGLGHAKLRRPIPYRNHLCAHRPEPWVKRFVRRKGAGEAEIPELDVEEVSAILQKDVPWLDVSVEDVVGVQVRNSGEDPVHDEPYQGIRRAYQSQKPVEVHVHQLCDEVHAVRGSGQAEVQVLQGEQVGVLRGLQQGDLPQGIPGARGPLQRPRYLFDRHAVQVRRVLGEQIEGLVHHAKRPRAQRLDEQVALLHHRLVHFPCLLLRVHPPGLPHTEVLVEQLEVRPAPHRSRRRPPRR